MKREKKTAINTKSKQLAMKYNYSFLKLCVINLINYLNETEGSGVVLLLHRHVSISGQDGGDLSLHEGPGHGGPSQGTALSAWAVHLSSGALAADGATRAGEAELVVRDGGTLDKMSVLQALSAKSAAEESPWGPATGLPGTGSAGSSTGSLPHSCLGDCCRGGRGTATCGASSGRRMSR